VPSIRMSPLRATVWRPTGVRADHRDAGNHLFGVGRSASPDPRTTGSVKVCGCRPHVGVARASFLLQCGLSPWPQRILAVSYKRDAAFNIAKRVSARCHPEQAHRFDSFTIDAFAKSLVDRFGQALPPEWRPTPDYEIAQARDPIVRDFLRSLAPLASVGTYADIMAITVKGFDKNWVVALPLAFRRCEAVAGSMGG